MNFDEYLESILGKREKNKLLKALKANKTIIISGPSGPTGKTTLANVLRTFGYTVHEKDLSIHEICLTEPLKECTPFFWREVH